MPRGTIKSAHEVEHPSILNERGEPDRGLEPGIPAEPLLAMDRAMLPSRRFDERLPILQHQGRLGTFAPAKGREAAAQVGRAEALHEADRVVPPYRGYRGRPLRPSDRRRPGRPGGVRVDDPATVGRRTLGGAEP